MSDSDSGEDSAFEPKRRRKVDPPTKPAATNRKNLQLNILLDKASAYAQFLSGQLSQETYETVVGDVPTSRVHQPSLVTGGTLRDYQMVAVNWLISLFENGVNGILADEMGLGKTVITVSFFAHLWEKNMFGPFLVVGPLSTLANWKNEFEKFTPDIPAMLYHGSPEERVAMREEFEEMKRNDAQKLPVVITSYDIAMRDRFFLEKHEWRFLVVDEAHRLKNFNCKLLRELRKVPSLNRLLLTGTPLQNNLAELWSLLNYILPEIFDSLDNFQSWFDFEDDLAEDHADSAKQAATQERLQSKSQLVQKLHNVLRPFFLRRLKSEVLHDLPTKREVVLYAGMTPVQREYYNAVKSRDLDKLTATSDASKVVKRPGLMNLLMQMRKVCNHPALMDENFDNFFFNFRAPDHLKVLQLSDRQREEQKASDRTRTRAVVDYAGPNDAQFNALLKEFDRREALDDRRKLLEKKQRAGHELSPDELADLLRDEGDGDVKETGSAVPDKIVGARSPFIFFVKENRAATLARLQSELLKRTPEPMNDEPVKKRRRGDDGETDQGTDDGDSNPDEEGSGDDLPTKVSMGALMRAMAESWHTLSDDQRAPYEALAAADRERAAAEKAARISDPSAIIEDPDEYLHLLRESSGKFQLLDKMLPRLLRDGHHVLIFSQMTRMLDILEDYLALSRISYRRIDGSTKQADRQQYIDDFNSDPTISLFLLSTRAGGLGINLTAADTVIIYDSDWNPQGDLQAQDRAHRMGQKRAVAVYRLITTHSCEARLLRRATEKLKLESLVIQKGNFKRRSQVKLTDTDLQEILELEMGDADMGREKPITDAELDKVLDREWLVNDFDKVLARKKQSANLEVPTDVDLGFELLEETKVEKF